MEDDIRSRLVVHFMGPLQKCQSRQGRSFPMKLILHCITVGLVTSQVCACDCVCACMFMPVCVSVCICMLKFLIWCVLTLINKN